MCVITGAIDPAKNLFAVHGVDDPAKPGFTKQPFTSQPSVSKNRRQLYLIVIHFLFFSNASNVFNVSL